MKKKINSLKDLPSAMGIIPEKVEKLKQSKALYTVDSLCEISNFSLSTKDGFYKTYQEDLEDEQTAHYWGTTVLGLKYGHVDLDWVNTHATRLISLHNPQQCVNILCELIKLANDGNSKTN